MQSLNIPDKDLQIRKLIFQRCIRVAFRNNKPDFKQIDWLWAISINLQEAQNLVQNSIFLTQIRAQYRLQLDVLTELSKIPTLVHLQLSCSLELFLQASPKLYNIKVLHLTAFLWSTKQFLLILKNMPQLESIGCLEHSDKQIIQSLKALKHLKGVKLFSASPHDAVLLARGLLELVFLEFESCEITDNELKKIVECSKNVEELNMHSNEITSEGAVWLGELKSLAKLNFPNNSIGPEGILLIGRSLLLLKQISVDARQLSDQSLREISLNLKLEKLIIRGKGNLNTNSLNWSLANIKSLKQLRIDYHSNNRTLKVISLNLRLLYTLILYKPEERLRDSGLFYLSQLKGLREIDLRATGDQEIKVDKILRNITFAERIIVTANNDYFHDQDDDCETISKEQRNEKVFRLTRHFVVNV